MVDERKEPDAVLTQLRGVERAIEELIVELDFGLKRALGVQEAYFKKQLGYQRVTAITVVLAALFLLVVFTAHVIHEWWGAILGLRSVRFDTAMVHELQETDAVLRQLRGVERAIDDLILEVDAGLKRSSVLHADYF
jgi:DNA-binding FrmR family transcriptional regulator